MKNELKNFVSFVAIDTDCEEKIKKNKY